MMSATWRGGAAGHGGTWIALWLGMPFKWTREAAIALVAVSLTTATTSWAEDGDEAPSSGPRGQAMVDRNPKMATAGKAMVLAGLPVAGIGAALIAVGSRGGGRDDLGFEQAGNTLALGGGLALTSIGGVCAITGVVLWAVGETDVKRERVRVLRPSASLRPALTVGPTSLSAQWRF